MEEAGARMEETVRTEWAVRPRASHGWWSHSEGWAVVGKPGGGPSPERRAWDSLGGPGRGPWLAR